MKRKIDLSGPEGNVYCILSITYEAVLAVKGIEEAVKLKEKVLFGTIPSYSGVLDYCYEKAKEIGVELIYQNKHN